MLPGTGPSGEAGGEGRGGERGEALKRLGRHLWWALTLGDYKIIVRELCSGSIGGSYGSVCGGDFTSKMGQSQWHRLNMQETKGLCFIAKGVSALMGQWGREHSPVPFLEAVGFDPLNLQKGAIARMCRQYIV
ncbi:hypothetical protein Tco_0646868 [Tanacetum coccineum]